MPRADKDNLLLHQETRIVRGFMRAVHTRESLVRDYQSAVGRR